MRPSISFVSGKSLTIVLCRRNITIPEEKDLCNFYVKGSNINVVFREEGS
jgi:hypothetical protein